jgi:hypothetical protein
MIPPTPAIQALFNEAAFWAALREFAPQSPYSLQKLSLVDCTPRDGYGLKITGRRNAEWENCTDPEWFQGTNDELQIRRAVSPKEVALAAVMLNVLTVAVGRELEAWTAANKANIAACDMAEAEQTQTAENAQLEQDWKAAIKAEAALHANREFPGPGNQTPRQARREEIERLLLATLTPFRRGL